MRNVGLFTLHNIIMIFQQLRDAALEYLYLLVFIKAKHLEKTFSIMNLLS